jgi:hypothetical protein
MPSQAGCVERAYTGERSIDCQSSLRRIPLPGAVHSMRECSIDMCTTCN